LQYTVSKLYLNCNGIRPLDFSLKCQSVCVCLSTFSSHFTIFLLLHNIGSPYRSNSVWYPHPVCPSRIFRTCPCSGVVCSAADANCGGRVAGGEGRETATEEAGGGEGVGARGANEGRDVGRLGSINSGRCVVAKGEGDGERAARGAGAGEVDTATLAATLRRTRFAIWRGKE
jgi:hypothetical protein